MWSARGPQGDTVPEICFQTKVWRSGAAWVAQMTVQAIAGEGATIAFVSPRVEPASREPTHPNVQRIVTPRELVGPGHPRARRLLASLGRIFGDLGSVLRLRPTTRVFIFSIPDPLVFSLPVFALLRLSGARVILVVHDAQPHAWSYRRLAALERAGHALSYRLASAVVPLTRAAAGTLRTRFGVPARKIAVIPHGAFSVGEVPPLSGNGRLLAFGSIRRNKRILETIRGVVLARRRGLPVTLVVAGEPLRQEPGYWEECLAAAAEDPAGVDIRRGFVPDERLPALFADADAFVLAYEDFDSQSGVGVLAAMSRRPVIGTSSGGLSELAEHGLAVETIAPPVSPESVADAIAAFCAGSPESWRARAAAGHERIAATLSWRAIARDYVRLARGQPLDSMTAALR
jgi:glycosyltransferase involved in cell wall biosynthesis